MFASLKKKQKTKDTLVSFNRPDKTAPRSWHTEKNHFSNELRKRKCCRSVPIRWARTSSNWKPPADCVVYTTVGTALVSCSSRNIQVLNTAKMEDCADTRLQSLTNQQRMMTMGLCSTLVIKRRPHTARVTRSCSTLLAFCGYAMGTMLLLLYTRLQEQYVSCWLCCV